MNKSKIIFILLFLIIFAGCALKENPKNTNSFYKKYKFNYYPKTKAILLHFPFNKAYLDSKDLIKLKEFLHKITKNDNLISIEVSCDLCGNNKYNNLLGEKRIKFVENIIKKELKNKKYIILNKINLSNKFSIKCKEKNARFVYLVIDTNI